MLAGYGGDRLPAGVLEQTVTARARLYRMYQKVKANTSTHSYAKSTRVDFACSCYLDGSEISAVPCGRADFCI